MKTIFFISYNKLYIVMTWDCHSKVLNVGPLYPSSFLSLSFILILYSNLLHCYLFIICIQRKFNVKWFCNNLSIRTRIGGILMRKISAHHCISVVCRPWEDVQNFPELGLPPGILELKNFMKMTICGDFWGMSSI